MVGRFATVEPLDPDRHFAELFEANSDDREGRLWTYYNFGPFGTLPEYRAWLDAACANPDRLYHAIRDNAQGRAVGVAVYQNCVPAMGTIEIGGLVFSPRLQRRPVAVDDREPGSVPVAPASDHRLAEQALILKAEPDCGGARRQVQ